MKLRFLSFILLAGVVTNSVAQLTLTLNTNTLAGEPGQVLSFNGTLRNESGSEIFLNGISISLGGIDLTPDESPFFLNFPISLAASQQASGVLFTVAIANTAPEQTVSGDLTVSGGTNAATLDLLTNATFQVQVLPKPGPEIVVEHPVGTGLADGLATVNFGGAPVGGSSQRTITIGNHGASNLTGLSITIDGANAGDFTVTANPTVPVVPNGSTTFTVTFAPGGTCARAAALHITSNDGDESPFDIALTGLGTETNPPSINCAANILAAVDPGQSSRSNVTYSVTFGDDCPGAILTQTAGLPSGATFPVGTTTNRFIATDTSGNTNTCSFTVTIFYNPGALQVTINPPGAVSAGAQWQLDGGAYQNSGTVVTNLSAGNHTVSFSTVAGWITPGNQIVAVGSDTTNTVSGNYIAQGTLIWINPAGGNWNNPNNWNPNQVPGPADTAVLTQAVTVTVNVPVTVRNVTLANTTLAASSGLIVTGTMDWTSGILNGTATIAAGAVLNIVTANVHDMYNCTFTNHGTVVWSDGLVRGGHNPGTFIHNFGLWDAQNDLTLNNAYAGVGTVFNNAGIYRKSGGASTNTITDGVTFNNTGLLEVMTGSLALHGNGSFTGGTTTNAGGLIQLAAGTYLINGTTTTTNVQLIGGTLGNGTVLRGELTW
ncbi:MAG TPA: HYR domain-containing protein, partial [Methylomirabilota bacterium]|nr:HYR domain-containing protein [Methylomirabilota bacterium]